MQLSFYVIASQSVNERELRARPVRNGIDNVDFTIVVIVVDAKLLEINLDLDIVC